jgi:hypothetical protein
MPLGLFQPAVLLSVDSILDSDLELTLSLQHSKSYNSNVDQRKNLEHALRMSG